MEFFSSFKKQSLQTKSSGMFVLPFGNGGAGQPYQSNWPVDRAIEVGLLQNPWVYRAAHAIASNAAGLPFILRLDNQISGLKKDDPLLNLLNQYPNDYETSYGFRYRLSQTILLSKMGAFIKIKRSRGGDLLDLSLIPPAQVRPVPDKKTFVSEYVVGTGPDEDHLSPEEVLWIKLPHPTDPWQGLTPLEAAGLSIETDIMARKYNRNFLQNDGRPGGILGVKGGMEESDANIMKNRFLGPGGPGPNGAGRLTVIDVGEEGGLDWVDTTTHPRDAQYVQMMDQVKKTILICFGVPESIAGDASGRCLKSTEYIRLSNGERHLAKDLVGKTFKVLTSTLDGPKEVEAWANWEAVEPCYKLITESGRKLEVNAKHPLWAAEYFKAKTTNVKYNKQPEIVEKGWISVGNLKPGDLIASVDEFPTTSCIDFDIDAAIVLGYLVGDGSISQEGGHVALTTPQGVHSEEFAKSVERLGDVVKKYHTPNRVDMWGVSGGAVRKILKETGLLGCNVYNKFIPSQIFSANQEAQAAFISRLFAADGSSSVTIPESGIDSRGHSCYGVPTIELTTVNEQLARDTQELLIRFGVRSRITESWHKAGIPSLNKKRFHSYHVVINRSEDITKFCTRIGIYGKEEAVQRAEKLASEQFSRGRTPKWQTRQLNPGLFWEKIKSIEYVGIDQTVGVYVPDYHTYMSVFYEHNTYDNAASEIAIFWRETMLPHLNLIGRAIDRLAPEGLLATFDTSMIYVLDKDKRESDSFHLDELKTGAINVDRYLEKTGQDPLGDSHRYISKLLLPYNDDGQIDDGSGHPDFVQPETPAVPAVPQPADTSVDDNADSSQNTGDAPVTDTNTDKRIDSTFDLRVKSWENHIEKQMKIFFKRQERVVLEKLLSRKMKEKWGSGEAISAEDVLDFSRWNEQLGVDIKELAELISSDFGVAMPNGLVGAVVAENDHTVKFVETFLTKARKGNVQNLDIIAKEIEKVFDGAVVSRSSKIAQAIMKIIVSTTGVDTSTV
jgi:HK97 family phage portal protein